MFAITGRAYEAHSEKSAEFFTVVFYGRAKFRCKSAQFSATRRESEMAETPSVGNAAQPGEKERKNSFLNYEFPTLRPMEPPV
jgi:hypothetical protein